ncbi:ABC transporter, partial [Shewanella sp. 0m-11]
MLRNTLLLAQFEVKKMLFNPRGLIALVAFALVWLL